MDGSCLYVNHFGFGSYSIAFHLRWYNCLRSKVPLDDFSLGGEYFPDTVINGRHPE